MHNMKHKANILVVDDEPGVLEFFSDSLTGEGYRVVGAVDGKDAFSRFQEESFDLVMTDLRMPVMDGIGLLKEVVKHDPTVPVIVFSAIGEMEDMVEILRLGAANFFRKPLQWDEVLFAVEKALEKRELLLEKARLIDELKTINQELDTKVRERTRELDHVGQTFQLFVPKPFLDRILAKSFKVGQFEEESFSILFSDIRSFTRISEKMAPSEIFEFLHAFFTLSEPIIARNQGFVDKYIGDATMALFGGPEAPENAVRAAVEIQQEMVMFNISRTIQRLPPIHIGTGINTGKVMVGTMGSYRRLSSTVIGDPVNVASRIEGLTKRYNARILISQYTFEALKTERFSIREIDMVKLRGRKEPMSLYEVFDGDDEELKERKLKTRDNFAQGMALYRNKEFNEALTLFQQCLENLPQDKVVFEYIARCRYFQNYPPTGDFKQGIFETPDKLFNYMARERSLRHEVNAHAEVFHASRTRASMQSVGIPFSGAITNISSTGIQLSMDYPLEVGETAMITANFKDTPFEQFLGRKSYHFLGRVVWEYEASSAGKDQWKMGLEIVVMQMDREREFQNGLDQFNHEDA